MKPIGRLRASAGSGGVGAVGIADDAQLAAGRPLRLGASRPSQLGLVPMSAAVVSPFDSMSSCALASAASNSAAVEVADFRFHQAHRRIDEQAVFDPPALGGLGRGGNSRGFQRGAVGDRCMSIDAAEPHRAVADDRVEIGGRRKALVGPQLLVPAAADDPARVGIAPRHRRGAAAAGRPARWSRSGRAAARRSRGP